MVDLWLLIGLVTPFVVAIFYTTQKQLTNTYTPLEVSVSMHIVPTIALSVFLVIYPYLPNKSFLVLGGLSGLTNAISFILLTKAYSKDALSVIAPLRGITPIVVASIEPLVFTSIMYNETLLLASVLVAVGIYIIFYEDSIVKPFKDLFNPGPLFGLFSAVVIAFAVLVDRTVLVNYSIHPLTYTFYVSFFTLLWLLIYTAIYGKSIQKTIIKTQDTIRIGALRTLTLSLGLGLLSLISGSLMNILWQLNIVITVIIGGRLIGEENTKRRIIGAVIIVLAVILSIYTV